MYMYIHIHIYTYVCIYIYLNVGCTRTSMFTSCGNICILHVSHAYGASVMCLCVYFCAPRKRKRVCV